MPYTCDHCDSECESFWPSGGSDLICKTCFDGYTRKQGEEESDEDFATRHPYYIGADQEFNPLEMVRIFLRSVKDEHPELFAACLTNAKVLQDKAKEEVKEMELFVQSLESFRGDTVGEN